MADQPTLECRQLTKVYHQGPDDVEVIKGINFSLYAGQRVAITGASGSGKSTLLNLLGGLDTPTSGEVILQGQAYSSLADKQRSKVRNNKLGFVYQFHHLLGEFSALDNVAMAGLIGGVSRKQSRANAEQILNRVGLSHRLGHKPSELSGGERQRVAIARALANQPDCVLMDEPTGNLDRENALSIQSLLEELSQSISTSFVVVTHDPELAATMDASYHLTDGRLTIHNDNPEQSDA